MAQRLAWEGHNLVEEALAEPLPTISIIKVQTLRQQIFYVISVMATAQQFIRHTETNSGVALVTKLAPLASPQHINTRYSAVPVTSIMSNSLCNYVSASASLSAWPVSKYITVCVCPYTWLPVSGHSWDIVPGCCSLACLHLRAVRSASSVV